MPTLPIARYFLFAKVLLIFSLVATLAACGGGGAKGPTTDTNPPLVVATVTEIQLSTDVPELSSDGAVPVTIFADVKGEGSILLKDQPVTFTADSGALSVASPTTDANGRAKATLSTGGNKASRNILVTVKSGSLTQTTSVTVGGTKLTISAPSSLVVNSSTTMTVFLKDSAGNGISGQQVVFTSKLGNTFTPSVAITTATGQATISVNANVGGSETITAKALGATATQDISISPNNFVFVSPASATEVPLNTSQVVTVHFDVNGVNKPDIPISFSSTRGTIVAADPKTNPSGNANLTVSSTTAGIGTITANVSGASTQRDIEFVATNAAIMNISASPAVVGVNAIGTSTQQSTITAQIKDSAGNLVKNKVINFSIVDVTGGKLSPGSAITDSQGIASTVYTAGTTTSAQNGVTVSGVVAGTAVTASANLTVARQALFVDLGTDNTVRKSTDGPNYEKDYSVLVVDAGRGAVKGATVTVTLTPLTYGKGFYFYNDAASAWNLFSTIAGFPNDACLSEDRDGDGQLDTIVGGSLTNEDTNGDGLLTPSAVATVTASATTDNSGFAIVTIKYPAEVGNWVKVRLEARATVAASEGTGRVEFVLPVLASDFTNKTVSPPGNPSRFGQSGSCSDAL